MCPACHFKRLHTPADWQYHPYAGHGYQQGQGWSHRDLEPQACGGRLDSNSPHEGQDADRT
jgi:hypothetical protein